MNRPSAARSLPAFIKPMLASLGTAFDDDTYLFEVKWNGIRMLAFVDTPGSRLMNRHAVDTTSRYPECAFLAGLPTGIVLDGEMVVLRDGQPDLALLQGRDKTRSALGKLRVVAKAKHGLSAEMRAQLNAWLWTHGQERPIVPCRWAARWVRPELICRLSCLALTRRGECCFPICEQLL